MNTDVGVASRSVPMMTISNAELIDAPDIGASIVCPRCGQDHVVEHGYKVHPDGTQTLSKALSFYRCGEGLYLCAVEGKNVMRKAQE